jgi:hypothetical protein
MSTTRPFVYNTGTTIGGTSQVGDIAIGTTNQDTDYKLTLKTIYS